jgi:hypothetical protein
MRKTWSLPVAVVLIGLGVLAGSVYTSSGSGVERPDLEPLLPTSRPSDTPVPSVYVDRYTLPGKVLYRFDSVILNNGGALDLSMRNVRAVQAEFPGGEPSRRPSPTKPPESGATLLDRTARGAMFVYSPAQGHHHWHFQNAARYELLVDGRTLESAKVGFCMFDTWRPDSNETRFYPPDEEGAGGITWCARRHPKATFAREGISPGWGDLYAAQASWQWVDVTHVAPGRHRLRAVVNPDGTIDETRTDNNSLTVTRTIPGVVAAPRRAAAPADGSARVVLGGTIVAPGVPAVRDPDTCNAWKRARCYLHATRSSPLRFDVPHPPRHGELTILRSRGRQEVLTYTPAPGFRGVDTFAYTATVPRGLVSAPATVRITVS